MITLEDYAKRFVKPSVIDSIRSGRFDEILSDVDVLEIISEDEELIKELIDRINIIAKYSA